MIDKKVQLNSFRSSKNNGSLAVRPFLCPGRLSALPQNTHFYPYLLNQLSYIQTSNLHQIVTLNMLMKKGRWVHGPKFNILGARSQNVNLPVKTLKIAVFRPGPPQDVKNFHFFLSKTLVWDSFATFKTLTACPPDITPVYHSTTYTERRLLIF